MLCIFLEIVELNLMFTLYDEFFITPTLHNMCIIEDANIHLMMVLMIRPSFTHKRFPKFTFIWYEIVFTFEIYNKQTLCYICSWTQSNLTTQLKFYMNPFNVFPCYWRWAYSLGGVRNYEGSFFINSFLAHR